MLGGEGWISVGRVKVGSVLEGRGGSVLEGEGWIIVGG